MQLSSIWCHDHILQHTLHCSGLRRHQCCPVQCAIYTTSSDLVEVCTPTSLIRLYVCMHKICWLLHIIIVCTTAHTEWSLQSTCHSCAHVFAIELYRCMCVYMCAYVYVRLFLIYSLSSRQLFPPTHCSVHSMVQAVSRCVLRTGSSSSSSCAGPG